MAEQLGRHERALDAYAQALAEEPQWAGSGFWTESAFRRQSLEQIILRAVAQDTGEADLWFAAGDYERALEATIAPLTADEYAARGRAHLALGAFEDAQRDLARALALCPSCAEVYVDRAVLDWELGQVENAGRDARTALFVNPGRGTRAHLVLAWIALDRGDVDAAIVHLERAVPPRTGDYNWSAVLYNRRGDLGLLPQLLQIEGGADWFAPWLQLADLYVSLGHPADAADLYRLILARDPFVPGVAERLTALR
jgi:tetratricopeptide (TPR) repeat protein